ncbi:hypothetical protein ACH4UY_14340 [Streptomyces longwoodensis]|uniref:hypothetical protein n=1 Tax=Streptomyces longwoodensis TaxID=68231 RepID=UPI00378C45DA
MTSEQTPDAPRTGRAARSGPPAQTPGTAPAEPSAPVAGERPRRLTYAAALVALEGLALVVAGLWMLVLGVAGNSDDRQQAVTGGITLVVLALLPLLAARGLLALRSWSRGPAVITQIMALPVAYNLLQADSVAIPAGIVLGVVAIAALVLLINRETTRALGIRGPGRAQDEEPPAGQQRSAGRK